MTLRTDEQNILSHARNVLVVQPENADAEDKIFLIGRLNDAREALEQISSLWPEPPNCADVMGVYGINDGKSRAILLQGALEIARKALGKDCGV